MGPQQVTVAPTFRIDDRRAGRDVLGRGAIFGTEFGHTVDIHTDGDEQSVASRLCDYIYGAALRDDGKPGGEFIHAVCGDDLLLFRGRRLGLP